MATLLPSEATVSARASPMPLAPPGHPFVVSRLNALHQGGDREPTCNNRDLAI